MIELVASDIDETIVDDSKNVPLRNTEAIAKAEDMGVKVILATGRGPYELNEIPNQAGVIRDDRYIICCNGAIILRASDRVIVDSNGLSFKYAKAIFDYAYENELEFFIYALDKKYAINLDQHEHSNVYTNDTNIELIKDDNIDFLEGEIILKALIKNRNIDYLHSLEVDIAAITNYDLEISYSSDMYMEINAKGVDKGIALQKVCDGYGIDIKNTLAVGDNYNDVAMLETAGIGVAVANAHLQVKEVSDTVTTATNNEGAVAEAIERFVLNKESI